MIPLAFASVSHDAIIINDAIEFLMSRKWGATWPFSCDGLASTLVILNWIGEDNRNEAQHDFFLVVWPLASAPCDAYESINGIIEFLIWRYQNEVQHDFFDYAKPLASVLCDAVTALSVSPSNSSGQDCQSEVQHDLMS